MKDMERRVLQQWARIGIMFNVSLSKRTPDLEQLLIDTATVVSGNARLFVMATTWVNRYEKLISKRRLRHMVEERLDSESKSILGLMLDISRGGSREKGLMYVMQALQPCDHPQPLFKVDRSNREISRLVKMRASAISRKWNLWTEPITFHPQALRPMKWIYARNPSLRFRAIIRGDLKVAIMEWVNHMAGGGTSEAELARLCDATRKATHEAIDHLEFSGFVSRTRHGRKYCIVRP